MTQIFVNQNPKVKPEIIYEDKSGESTSPLRFRLCDSERGVGRKPQRRGVCLFATKDTPPANARTITPPSLSPTSKPSEGVADAKIDVYILKH